MNEKEFNKYCVEVMGEDVLALHPAQQAIIGHAVAINENEDGMYEIRNYWDNLNQMAVVVEKLIQNLKDLEHVPTGILIDVWGGANIKQAMRDFIWSTKDGK